MSLTLPARNQFEMNPAIPTGWSEAEIRSLAEKFASAVGYKSGTEISPIVEDRLHGKIEYLDWEDWQKKGVETIEVRGPNDFTIYLSRVGGLFNNRYGIAHELGHYILHSKMGEIPLWAQNSKKDERAEWEANWFAISLLMPEGDFKKHYAKNPNRWYLASRFLVSPEAVNIRKQTLGLA